MPTRHVTYGTVESGSLTEPVRIELPDMHLWLYPKVDAERDGRMLVVVEFEAKSVPEMFPVIDVTPGTSEAVPSGGAAYGQVRVEAP